MTALVDIGKALATSPPVERGKRRYVLLGRAAMLSIRCEMPKHVKPVTITFGNDRLAIVETDQFPGWDIVDRPEPL